MEIDRNPNLVSPPKSTIKKRRLSARSPIDSKGSIVFENILNENEKDNIVIEMIQLSYDTIYQSPIDEVDSIIQKYGMKYEIEFPPDYFSTTKEIEKRDQLFLYTLEIHSVYTSSTITPSTTSTYINALDPMIA